MEGDHIKNYNFLLPLSWLYGLGVGIRNVLFDLGILKSKSFDLPIICVGNLTVGGTGKTPHTEYLIQLLKTKYQVAVLSRGYKRKSKGFVLAEKDTPMHAIGDEPYQMKQKYPDVRVAVDKDRRHGVTQLLKASVQPPIDVVILDDAYQHRYIQPGVNILLMDYHRLIYFDKLLPAGRLREPRSGISRADIIIVTKCPPYITPMDKRGIERSLEIENWQTLFFSTFKYGTLYPLFSTKHGAAKTMSMEQLKSFEQGILLISGIASPQQLEYDLSKYTTRFESYRFADHHQFTQKDIKDIESKYHGGIIITTEKDASRLRELGANALSPSVAEAIYVLPIQVEFMADTAERFDSIIKSYVQKNSRYSTLIRKQKEQ